MQDQLSECDPEGLGELRKELDGMTQIAQDQRKRIKELEQVAYVEMSNLGGAE